MWALLATVEVSGSDGKEQGVESLSPTTLWRRQWRATPWRLMRLVSHGQSLIPPAPLVSNWWRRGSAGTSSCRCEWKLQRCRPFLWCQRNAKAALYCYVHPNGPQPESRSKGSLINSCWSDWIFPNHRCYYLRFPVPTFTAMRWMASPPYKDLMKSGKASPPRNGN